MEAWPRPIRPAESLRRNRMRKELVWRRPAPLHVATVQRSQEHLNSRNAARSPGEPTVRCEDLHGRIIDQLVFTALGALYDVALLAYRRTERLLDADRFTRRTARWVRIKADAGIAVLARRNDYIARDPELIDVIGAAQRRRTLHFAAGAVSPVDNAGIGISDRDVLAVPLNAARPFDLLLQGDVGQATAALAKFGECELRTVIGAVGKQVALVVVAAETKVRNRRIRIRGRLTRRVRVNSRRCRCRWRCRSS